MNVKRRIEEARKRLGWTQEELAREAKLTLRTVQSLESSDPRPRLPTLEAVAKALGCKVADLVS